MGHQFTLTYTIHIHLCPGLREIEGKLGVRRHGAERNLARKGSTRSVPCVQTPASRRRTSSVVEKVWNLVARNFNKSFSRRCAVTIVSTAYRCFRLYEMSTTARTLKFTVVLWCNERLGRHYDLIPKFSRGVFVQRIPSGGQNSHCWYSSRSILVNFFSSTRPSSDFKVRKEWVNLFRRSRKYLKS